MIHIKSHHHHGIGPAFHLEMPMDNLCRVNIHPLPVPKLLPASWVEQMMTRQIGDYGYQMWLCEYPGAALSIRMDQFCSKYQLTKPVINEEYVSQLCKKVGINEGTFYRVIIADFRHLYNNMYKVFFSRKM